MAIFAYASKEHMIATCGLVLTSLEIIEEKVGYFSHWTPNVYCYGSYKNETNQVTRGHSETNLKQININQTDDVKKTVASAPVAQPAGASQAKVLPTTGEGRSALLSALGLLSLVASVGVIAKKRQD